MTSARALALGLAVAAGCATVAVAQTLPWPTNGPQGPAQAPWPAAAQPEQPGPQMMPAGPAGPPMQGMQGPPPNEFQQKCLQQFTVYREEVEKRGMAAKAAGEKHVTREEMCKMVTVYSDAEVKWIKFSVDNMSKCGIPKGAIDQIKGAHSHTAEARKKICEGGPTQAGPAAPTLSDALGSAVLPTAPEPEKRKAGGSLDTLTGNALQR
jgi:hypothetical protein